MKIAERVHRFQVCNDEAERAIDGTSFADGGTDPAARFNGTGQIAQWVNKNRLQQQSRKHGLSALLLRAVNGSLCSVRRVLSGG
ncbi:MAG: hypothetical protein ACREPT_08580 [Rudaea sp.]